VTSEKFPITVTRLKTFVLLGHSNADGWAGSSPMFTDYGFGPPTVSPGEYHVDAYYKNYYVFTSDIPWAGVAGTPVLSDIGNGEWLEATISNPQDDAHEHPFPSPYRYPNVRGSCYPNCMHSATSPALHGGGVHLGIEIPFFWHLSHHFQEPIGMIKLAFSSTLFLRSERGGGATTPIAAATWFDVFGYSALSPGEGRPRTAVDPNEGGFYGWWKPFTNFDWAPSAERLYGLWLDKMVGAQAALPAGTKMDVRVVIPWFGENDALTRSLATLQANFKSACVAFIKRIRSDLVENDWTTLPEKEIPIIWPGLQGGYNNGTEDTVDFCNGVLDEIEAQDPFFRRIPPDDWASLTDEGYTFPLPAPATHYGPGGYVQAASDIFDAFREMEVEPYDALDEEDRVSVSSVMDRVRTYYTRARVNTDVEDEPLLQHINGALFHIVNLVGDNAWFLRRRASLALDVGPNTPVTLPRYVDRLLKIETPEDVLRAIPFEQTGFVEGGKLQVLVRSRASGTYTIHFITQPRELTRNEQLVPLPFQMIEWLVVETCRRLARSSSNLALQASLEGETRQLQVDCMRNMGAMQRSRNDRLQKQMRLPNPRVWRNRGRSFGSDLG